MNNQGAFNKAYHHLLTQNAQSAGTHGDCQYRGPNNTMCAVGCLIPDDLYNRRMEGISIYALLDRDEGLKELFKNVDELLLSWLQEIHDDYEPEYWQSELSLLAKKFNLTIPS